MRITFSKISFLCFVAALSVVVGLFSLQVPTAHASSLSGDLHGYAWSDDIGWMSLNCAEGGSGGSNICTDSSYKVQVTSDVFSGFAWSDSIGWVSFNASDIGSCSSVSVPATAGTYDETSGLVSGWARALAGGSGGWDGCISLGDSAGTYGLKYDGTGTPPSIGGTPLPGSPFLANSYAWGETNVGWLDFSDYATIGNATVTIGSVHLMLDPLDGLGPRGGFITMPVSGGPANITWTSTGDVASCTASETVTGSGGGPITDWGVMSSMTTGLPGTSTGPVSITVPVHPSGVADAYSITCVTSTGSPVPPDTVVVIPPSTTGSTCGVVASPSSFTLTGSGAFGPLSESLSVTWSGTFSPTSFTVDPPGGGITVSPLSGTISSSAGTLPLMISGTIPTTSVPITVHALGSDGTTCIDGTITIIPPTGSTGTGGTSRPVRFPWKEL